MSQIPSISIEDTSTPAQAISNFYKFENSLQDIQELEDFKFLKSFINERPRRKSCADITMDVSKFQMPKVEYVNPSQRKFSLKPPQMQTLSFNITPAKSTDVLNQDFSNMRSRLSSGSSQFFGRKISGSASNEILTRVGGGAFSDQMKTPSFLGKS